VFNNTTKERQIFSYVTELVILVYVVMLQNRKKKKNKLWLGDMKECQFSVTLY